MGGGTVLVVSPLLALMRDQLDHLPPGMPAAMLWGGQPRAAAMAVLDDLRVPPPARLPCLQDLRPKLAPRRPAVTSARLPCP